MPTMSRRRGGPPSRSSGRAAAIRPEQRRIEQWLAPAGLTIIFLLVASFWFVVPVPAPLGWSMQVLLLCLVLGAGASRVLSGEARRAEEAAWPVSTGLCATLVGLAAVLPYLHSLRVGFLSDDYGLYMGVRRAQSLTYVFSAEALPGFLRPVAILLWWAGARWWGPTEWAYHAVNLLLHAANAVLVFALGRRLIGSAYAGFLAGVLFAVHPLHVEPVVWVCCNADLLSTGFCLLSLLAADEAVTAASVRRRVGAAAGSCAAFALALLSKESAITLPLAILLLVVLKEVRGEGREERLSLGSPAASRGRATGWVIVAASLGLAAAYLAWRWRALGSIGGYRVQLNPWNTLFPSAPLRHLASFLFPVNKKLLGTLAGPWLGHLLAIGMAIGAYWWLRGLPTVPARRLIFYTGFLVVMSLPVWAMPAGTMGLEHSRYAYLPTLGLACLFGDLCGGRGRGWGRSGAAAVAILGVSAALTAWYVFPWLGARGKADQVIAAAARLWTHLEKEHPGAVLYVQGVPGEYRGAQVMTNSFGQALLLKYGKPMAVRMLHPTGDMTPEVFAASELVPGEYLAAWQDGERRFTIIRKGGGEDRR